MPRNTCPVCWVIAAVILVEALLVDTFIAKLTGTVSKESVLESVSSEVHDNTNSAISIVTIFPIFSPFIIIAQTFLYISHSYEPPCFQSSVTLTPTSALTGCKLPSVCKCTFTIFISPAFKGSSIFSTDLVTDPSARVT